jgi:hypothetical protein
MVLNRVGVLAPSRRVPENWATETKFSKSSSALRSPKILHSCIPKRFERIEDSKPRVTIYWGSLAGS